MLGSAAMNGPEVAGLGPNRMCAFMGSAVGGIGPEGHRQGSSCRRLRHSTFVSPWLSCTKGRSAAKVTGGDTSRTVPTAVFLWLHGPEEDGSGEDAGEFMDEYEGPDEDVSEEQDQLADDAEYYAGQDTGSPYGTQGFGGRSPSSVALAKSYPIYNKLKDTEPEDTDVLRTDVSGEALAVIQKTAQRMVGSLPAQTFEVQITTDRNGIERLLHSSMVTGYVIRNAEFRMRMNEKVREGAAKVFSSVDPQVDGGAPLIGDANSEYIFGVPDKRRLVREDLQGNVSWYDEESKQDLQIGAGEYVSRLENEIRRLQNRLQPQGSGDMTNRLPHQNIATMGTEISEAAMIAMRRILNERLGTLDRSKMKTSFALSRETLALFVRWCLLIGYNVRNLEKQEEVSELLSSYRRGMHMRSNSPSSSVQDEAE